MTDLDLYVVSFTMAAHVVPALLAALLDGAYNRHGMCNLRVCCLRVQLTKNPIAARTGLHVGLPVIYLVHGIPTKPTTVVEMGFTVQGEGTMTLHFPHRYDLPNNPAPGIQPAHPAYEQAAMVPFIGSSPIWVALALPMF